ncbi:MAG: penicillin-binding protein activator LpoB [Candidatus Hydrogenedentes bacterium]|nr:penicillin-binding protein activator LpoB [Candidatus Hydrogenedentota bacterium]
MLILSMVCGCKTTNSTHVERQSADVAVYSGSSNTPSRASSKYIDPGEQSSISTVDIESSDIVGACKEMVNKMLANPLLANQAVSPHIIVDASELHVQTTDRINPNMFADLLRTELFKAANGRLRFVSRERYAAVQQERALEEQGIVGEGTTGTTKRQTGSDYRFVGRFTDHQVRSASRVERLTQFNIEIIDLNSGELVFADSYLFKKGIGVPAAYR